MEACRSAGVGGLVGLSILYVSWGYVGMGARREPGTAGGTVRVERAADETPSREPRVLGFSDRLAVVVNPAAGNGRALRAVPVVLDVFGAAGLRARVDVARGLGHAGDLAAAAADRGEVVVAVGGDGLTGRLAGVVAERGGLLGIIPAGRCNDFARMLGVPRKPAAAATALRHGVERHIDLLRADGHAAVGSVYMGIDALANELAQQQRLLRDRAGYVAACLRVLRRWRPVRYRVEMDGMVAEFAGFTVVAANAAYFGGGLTIVPDADVTDGQVDVALFRHAPTLTALRILGGVVAGGSHVHRPEVTVRRGRRLTVTADRDLPVYGDGEPLTRLPVTVELVPGGLRMLLPLELPP